MVHDTGGSVRFPLDLWVSGGAVFAGEDDCYRVSLWCCWGDPEAPFALWIGMNPSTATAIVDDPTVRRETGFARRFGLSRIVKMNVSAYRATNPTRLLEAPIDCPENLPAILDAAQKAAVIVLAFGVLRGRMRALAHNMVAALRSEQRPLMCLGKTKDGSPRHPLYLRGNAALVPWDGWIAEEPAVSLQASGGDHLRISSGEVSDVA